jgi:hypothetical protein
MRSRCARRNECCELVGEREKMAQARLRIYCGPQEHQRGTAIRETREPRRDTVTVPLGEIVPVLGEAYRNARHWLRDFDDDEVSIPTDLYEVILAYQHFRRPSA